MVTGPIKYVVSVEPLDHEAGVKCRTSHEPNRMLMRENRGFCSFEFDSAHVKYGI